MRYVKARIDECQREFAYRIFVTDCLGHAVGLTQRYVDFFRPVENPSKSAEEIIGGISAKLSLLGGEK